MSITAKLNPTDFQTKDHFWSTFDHHETEISAYWIVRFLKERMATASADKPVEGNGWAPFTYGELDDFYREKLGEEEGSEDHFVFNRLVEGTHSFVSSSPDPPKDRDVVEANAPSFGGFGFRHICRNDVCVVIEAVGKDKFRRDRNDIVTVTEKFVARLASQPRMLESASPS